MKPGAGVPGDHFPGDLCVVIGYEDLQSALRAMELHQRLIERNESAAVLKIWKFEPLGLPPLLDQAIEDACAADVVIISISGDRPLPLEATAWIEGWRAKRTREDGALLFLVDAGSEESLHANLARSYLENVARQGQFNFFSSPGALGDSLGGRFKSASVSDAVQHSSRYDPWGLNE